VGNPVVHFEIVGKDAETRMMGPDEPMEGLVVGLFTDPEGHLVGVVSG
jgi:hypothetical protein